MSQKLRIGVLASGGGTNLQAIIDRSLDGNLTGFDGDFAIAIFE